MSLTLCYPLAMDSGDREYNGVDKIPVVTTPSVMETGVRLIFRTRR